MKIFSFLILITILITSCSSAEKFNQQIQSLHSVASLHKDVDKAYIQLKKQHPNLNLYISKERLDYKFDSLKKSIDKPLTSYQFYAKIYPVIGTVKQGHIGVYAPKKHFTRKEYKAYTKKEFTFNDLDFDYLENKLLVINTRSKDSFLVGSEVVKIEEEPIAEVINKYKNLITSDGYNTTLYDRVLGNRFASYYNSDKYFIDSLQVTFKKEDSIFNRKFKYREKDKKKKDTITNDTLNKPVKVKLTKAERKENKQKAKLKRKHNQIYGYNKSRKEYTRNITFIGKDSAVAYMKIRGFMGGKYKTFYKEVFKKIDSSKTENLIIDIRNNGGGSLAEIAELYSYLAEKPFQFLEPAEVNSRIPYLKAFMSNTSSTGFKIFLGVFSPIIATHNLIKTKKEDGKLYYTFKQIKEAEPKSTGFKGDVYVLINGHSFSASSILSNQLQANKRAVFVGEETGGAYNSTVAGIFKIYELPETKLKMRIGLMQIETPFKQEPAGYGVKPDYKILPTIQDRKQNKDPELSFILQTIANKNKQ
ncbi:peptidase S41 [Lacinutrix sp. C3R15]|uniref:S41 family peptidase n=1 Tax=Flavobacteriaceae TaxID=49546 RepID=UPI001C0A4D0E|nr:MULTISPECIES: S41 family peptidase [Flavobacteriaceae]MBU2940528.1 peptidase S41 [Lacinutrix sp. C3R15]MDO6623848.1 S41 family peptidase [Oceanihabitans sp. 1_MG-2023]